MTAVGKSELRDVQTKPLSEDEVLIKVEACGLCTWERYIYSGEEPAGFPFHGGHETAGTVVEMGDAVQGLTPGLPVAVVSWKRCNACVPCRRGFDNHCETMMGELPEGTLWGPAGFAQYLVVKRYEVFPLGDKVPVHFGILAEPLSCVVRSIKRSHIKPEEKAVVIGAGLMGLLFMKVLKHRGNRVVVVQRSEARRKLALSMGADLVVDPQQEGWENLVIDYTGGYGAEAIFYTAGGASMLNTCLHLAAIGGSILMYAPLYDDAAVLEADVIHFRELNVVGSIRHDKESAFEAVRLLGSGELDLQGLNLVFEDLERFEEGIERANEDRNIHRIMFRA